MYRRPMKTAASLILLPSAAMAAAYVILLAFASCTPTDPIKPVNGNGDVATQLVAAHNAYRLTKNLPALLPNFKLMTAAKAHADFMAKRGKLAHQGIGDGSPGDRIAAAGYTISAGGENIAWNQRDVAAVMRAWIGSPGHRRNIEGSYKEIGVAVTNGPRKDPYWVAVFASPGRADIGSLQAEPGDDGTVSASEGGLLIPAARIGGP